MSRTYPHALHEVASFRWLANELENAALQKYMGDTTLYKPIHQTLVDAIKRIRDMVASNPCGDCPWECCPDDSCSPQCNPPSAELRHWLASAQRRERMPQLLDELRTAFREVGVELV